MPEAQSDSSSLVPFPTAPDIIFANWREALHHSGLSPAMKSLYSLALTGYRPS